MKGIKHIPLTFIIMTATVGLTISLLIGLTFSELRFNSEFLVVSVINYIIYLAITFVFGGNIYEGLLRLNGLALALIFIIGVPIAFGCGYLFNQYSLSPIEDVILYSLLSYSAIFSFVALTAGIHDIILSKKGHN